MVCRGRYVVTAVLLLTAACKGHLIDLDNPGQNNPPGTFVPALALSIGGSGFDQVVDLATDPDGSVYVTGTFTGSVDFDPGTGVAFLTSVGLADIFLAKYSAAGALLWADRIGGTSADSVASLARDASGNLYIGGSFEGASDFDPGPGTQILTSLGGADGFVAKFTSTGQLVWARRYGGVALDRVTDVTADPAGNVYAAGVFQGQADLTPEVGAVIVSNGATPDGFLLALDADGGARWAYPIGGPEDDAATAVAVTSNAAVVVAGTFRGQADFLSAAPATQLTSVGGTDGFVAGYSSAGVLRWARQISGTGDEDVQAGGLAPDASDGVVVTGSFAGTTTFAGGLVTIARTSLGPSDWYVAGYDVSGTVQNVFAVGGLGPDIAPHIAVDESGNILATGSFTGSVDFDPGIGTTVLTSLATAGSDAFAARYTPSGGLLWASSFGEATAAPDRLTAGAAIAAGGQGTAIVGGRFFGLPNFGTTATPFVFSNQGDADGFVIKLSAAGALAAKP
jgi:hypothetical protein